MVDGWHYGEENVLQQNNKTDDRVDVGTSFTWQECMGYGGSLRIEDEMRLQELKYEEIRISQMWEEVLPLGEISTFS